MIRLVRPDIDLKDKALDFKQEFYQLDTREKGV